MNNFRKRKFKKLFNILVVISVCFSQRLKAQDIKFMHNFSPEEGIVKPQEQPFRQEICLNGKWSFQPVPIPTNKLAAPEPDKWEKIKIKIPTPWNINTWGGGSEVGRGTKDPYAPSSVYYPSYPRSWNKVKMGWQKRLFQVPTAWKGKRILLHFEAVMGNCIVIINGHKVNQHFEGYLPFDIDITDFIKFNQPNKLLVGIQARKLFDKTSSEYKYFRSTYPPGSYTADLVGIWQDVFLLAVSPVRITNVSVEPWVDRDQLKLKVQLINQTRETQKITLNGSIKRWINERGNSILDAPEVKWCLGKKGLLSIDTDHILLRPGESKTVVLKTKVRNKLKLWSLSEPNLNTIILTLKNNRGKTYDCKTQRFGWRQFTIIGKNLYLNGKRIQCFADIQHPFGPYICSRRFAWAWFKMIKDFGGNAVRLHAQPWPRIYCDLADEMGLMVLDESAFFGSSLSLNFEDSMTWKRASAQIKQLVIRDRNHPSVIGWSVGNELFAIPMYNKATPEVKERWDKKIVGLTKLPKALDPTRSFITVDGDEDMGGNLPVWSKHFGLGLHLDQLPQINKPLVIGESGGTYYATPEQLFPFVGERAYKSYYGRNEALAVDVYQNLTKMALPFLAYFSPSEVSWFGIQHLNLGYHNFSRLPDSTDGIFAGLPYKEGEPGYQFERIPPYATTFNPGLDTKLPLYKPLPMFEALKAALNSKPCKWDHYDKPIEKDSIQFPTAKYISAYFVGKSTGVLFKQLTKVGIPFAPENPNCKLVIIDGDSLLANDLSRAANIINRVKKNGGLIWVMIADKQPSPLLRNIFPTQYQLTDRKASSLESNKNSSIGKYFRLSDLYFSELSGDRQIIKHGLTGELVKSGTVIFQASKTDWSLFNNISEDKKCAQVELYEHLKKPSGVAMVTHPLDSSTLIFSTIDYRIENKKVISFWRNLCSAMKIKTYLSNDKNEYDDEGRKKHNLLLNGPVN
jgi:beta-galactosidase